MRRTTILAALAAAALAPASAQATQLYTETPILSSAPDAGLVSESYVSLYAPLPAADGARPAACDRIGYLRFRAADGPSNPAKADAVLVAQPGIFEGAAAFDQVARHTIEAAAQNGYHVEFWALSRRSNCLTDTFGVQAAIAAHNPQVAFDYYYGGKPVLGQRFPGFVSEQNAAFLSHVGLAQTVQDEYTVISQLPQAFRQQRLLCGGHSLGGILTAAFANWDFSGSGAPSGAGYNQCAGWFALDTRLNVADGSTQILSSGVGNVLSSVLADADSGSPYIDVAPIAPDTLMSLPLLGMAASFSPQQRNTLLAQFPSNGDFNTTYHLLLADSYGDFLLGLPNARTINATNQSVLGEVFGDVSEPLGFIRASVGTATGGPLVEKNFPVPYGSAESAGGLLGGNDQVSPAPSAAVAGGPQYTWLNYNQIPTPGPSPTDDPGSPYTSAASEVSDINQLSRTLFDAAPALFTENYFPSALVLDTFAVAAGDRSGTLAALRYTNGITQHPAAYIDGGEGLTISGGGIGGPIPNGPAPQVHVVAPGYNHLDVLTAARTQNNGLPELSSSTLASWLAQLAGPPLP
jgi:hypothetical protein